ncbi:subtilase [Fusarium albosuccineum]|uniref:Subtilase n=1 Tax=Fusarium albosuccineum TaxID=1237068 RepID=A0A8H4L957_9HYPO|nr:subtilase [Fusarium albosuccineum]
MGLISKLRFGASTPVFDTRDIYDLLITGLSTFYDLADYIWRQLDDAEDGTEIQDFYLHFRAKVFNLKAVLVVWDPLETVQGLSTDENEVQKNILSILNELEARFWSWKGREACLACRRLQLERRNDETYPKLRALRRILPEDGNLDDSVMRDLSVIIRIDNKRADRREMLLRNLDQTLGFFYNLQPAPTESESSCPKRFSDYPLKNVWDLTRTLFKTLQRNWFCQCPNNPAHIDRKTRMNLTRHQRFDTSPRHGELLLNSQVDFRMFFPIGARALQWQDTKISVNELNHDHAEHREIKECFCNIIQGVKPGVLPRMAVSGSRLWQQQVETDLLSPLQQRENEFRSLKELLQTKRSEHTLSLSKAGGRDRLILSFVLATSLIHLFPGEEGVQTSMSSETICFLVSSRASGLDVTKPYFTASCSTPIPRPEHKILNEPHCVPDILSLGILLLEIARGTSIEYQDSQDRCVVALQCLDKWATCRDSWTWTVPDGLYRAISACIDPTHLRDNGLDKSSVKAFHKRKYIFERILFPLEDALSTAYEVQLSILHADIAQAKASAASDHYDERQQDKHMAADYWRKHLAGSNGVHDLVGDLQDLCENLSEADEKATHVKIAVLDTGLQLPTELQENYLAAGRINAEESESFLSGPKTTADQDWDIDCDGHGTCVGQIILDVAPVVDLHVARVFKRRSDLADSNMANQVHKNIVEAIDCATTKWTVDMIVMSLGFDEPIPLIRDAIEKASKAEKAPLFFAATRNDGAHKKMAWPARDHSVIGISSTDGYGSPSSFNPSENNFHPILYAFGEGVPVKVPVLNRPTERVIKYVSGTSYATPTAAALAANMLGCVRMAVKTSSRENQCIYSNLPLELQRMTGMLAVLRHRMSMEHNSGVSSLLPWDFLNLSRLDRDKILEDVSDTLKHY